MDIQKFKETYVKVISESEDKFSEETFKQNLKLMIEDIMKEMDSNCEDEEDSEEMEEPEEEVEEATNINKIDLSYIIGNVDFTEYDDYKDINSNALIGYGSDNKVYIINGSNIEIHDNKNNIVHAEVKIVDMMNESLDVDDADRADQLRDKIAEKNIMDIYNRNPYNSKYVRLDFVDALQDYKELLSSRFREQGPRAYSAWSNFLYTFSDNNRMPHWRDPQLAVNPAKISLIDRMVMSKNKFGQTNALSKDQKEKLSAAKEDFESKKYSTEALIKKHGAGDDQYFNPAAFKLFL